MATYTCKYCGKQSSYPSFAGSSCSKSPHGRCELMNATEKQPQYVCKYCGAKSSYASLAGGSCSKAPHKRHELLG